ncbi:MAG TPA: hypothetical protein VMG08_16190 [Allosphingosinicella sp.]|nr:hypothetical protein [Allosphingosinicella sp.]
MQLKLRRSQRDGGIFLNTAIFCLDARVEFTAEEDRRLNRYKLRNQVIYNSDASARLLARSEAQLDGTVRGSLKSFVLAARAALKLNISIATLERGQHVECKGLDELLGAESAIMEACENLKLYLDTAATFDGREALYEFEADGPKLMAHSMTPPPALVVEPSEALIPPAPVAAAAILPPASPAGPEGALVGEAPDAAMSGPEQTGAWSGLDYRQKRAILIVGALVLFLILVRLAIR